MITTQKQLWPAVVAQLDGPCKYLCIIVTWDIDAPPQLKAKALNKIKHALEIWHNNFHNPWDLPAATHFAGLHKDKEQQARKELCRVFARYSINHPQFTKQIATIAQRYTK